MDVLRRSLGVLLLTQWALLVSPAHATAWGPTASADPAPAHCTDHADAAGPEAPAEAPAENAGSCALHCSALAHPMVASPAQPGAPPLLVVHTGTPPMPAAIAGSRGGAAPHGRNPPLPAPIDRSTVLQL